MTKVVVSVFSSRREAEAAQARLREHGFHDGQIRILDGDTAPAATPERAAGADEDRGLVAAIELMSSGLLLDRKDDVVRYAHAVRRNKSLLALQIPDDAAPRALSILRDIGAAIEDTAPAETRALLSPKIYALPGGVGSRRRVPMPPDTLVESTRFVGRSPVGRGFSARGDRRRTGRRRGIDFRN